MPDQPPHDPHVHSAAEIIGQSKPIQKTCIECGQTFALEYPSLDQWVKACPACSEKHAIEHQAKYVERSKSVRSDRWKAICPAAFQGTDKNILPDKRGLRAVYDWRYGAKGLLFHGPTGSGKSRCAWLLMEREYGLGRSIGGLNSSSGLKYAAEFAVGAGEVERWLDRLIEKQLLLLDDVFKAKLTDSFENAIFMLICERAERELPIIVTTNDTGATLANRMSPDRAEPMIRRLRESCIECPLHR